MAAFKVTGRFCKEIPLNDERRLAWYIVTVTEDADGEAVFDHEGHSVTTDDMLGMAVRYMKESRVAGYRHKEFAGVGQCVISAPLTPEIYAGLAAHATQMAKEKHGDAAPAVVIPPMPTVWLAGIEIASDVRWADYKAGRAPMISMGGNADALEPVPS